MVVERRQLENKVLGMRRQWGPEPTWKAWPLGGGRRGQGIQLLVMLQGALKGERGEGGVLLGLIHSILSIWHTASTKD